MKYDPNYAASSAPTIKHLALGVLQASSFIASMAAVIAQSHPVNLNPPADRSTVTPSALTTAAPMQPTLSLSIPHQLSFVAPDPKPSPVAAPKSSGVTEFNFGVSDHPYPGNARAVAELGAGWLRTDFNWASIEPNGPGQFNWGPSDSYVQTAALNGLKVLAILDYTPSWARSSACSTSQYCLPADPGQYAAFAAAVASRYKGRISAFEIWNEPNAYHSGLPPPNADAYTQLLQDAYTDIKEVDPSATVIGGALSGIRTTGAGNISATDFLTQMYQDGAKGYFDALSVHPYTFPDLPSTSTSWKLLSTGVASLRHIMVTYGDGAKKIWCTEYGAPTSGVDMGPSPDPALAPHISEADQAQMLVQAVALWTSYPWAGPFFVYTTRDSPPSADREAYFGLLRFNGTRKPAYYAYQQAIAGAISR